MGLPGKFDEIFGQGFNYKGWGRGGLKGFFVFMYRQQKYRQVILKLSDHFTLQGGKGKPGIAGIPGDLGPDGPPGHRGGPGVAGVPGIRGKVGDVGAVGRPGLQV